jgi:hypothetical protein
MKLKPFRWRAAPTPVPAPDVAKPAFAESAPAHTRPGSPSRMYSLMLPSFTDRR